VVIVYSSAGRGVLPSAMSAVMIALLAIDAEFILDNGMTLFILYSV
jgi:hypothetical protein